MLIGEFFHLFSNPCFQLLEVYRGVFGEIGSQSDGLVGINRRDFLLGFRRIPVDQDPDTFSQAARNVDFVGAHERYVEPTELASCQGGKLTVQVSGRAENCTGYIPGIDVIESDHECEQLPRCGQDLVPIVTGSRSCSANATTDNTHKGLLSG